MGQASSEPEPAGYRRQRDLRQGRADQGSADQGSADHGGADHGGADRGEPPVLSGFGVRPQQKRIPP